ncbi:hypothetical protein ATPR_3522 [Acetobacter tropicalis NBRC 101654]|uniref:Uncharacterized protein n=1 Tax=Acetobacter tropicalis NBRC 101654 TaxID=749388 RepID=F7VJH3_9PROT|nr:hypothetical protein ATPR_3522 [Acetobacter tropicalis NBRC 101654]
MCFNRRVHTPSGRFHAPAVSWGGLPMSVLSCTLSCMQEHTA